MKGVFFAALATLAIPGLCSHAGDGEESIMVPVHSDYPSLRYGSTHEVVCDRRGQPPLIHHVYEAADMIQTDEDTNKEQHCYTDHKDGCTKIEEGMGARISVCWGVTDTNEDRHDIWCSAVAEMARLLAEKCGKEDRAGGRVYTHKTYDGEPLAEMPGYVQISRAK